MTTTQTPAPAAPDPTQPGRRRKPRPQAVAPRPSVREQLTEIGDSIRGAGRRWGAALAPVTRPVRAVLACVSGFGWLVLGAAVVTWWLSGVLGWQELRYAAAVLGALFALSCLLTLGRTSLQVEVRMEPPRVVAGDGAALRVLATNLGRAPLLPVPLDVPAINQTVRFGLPALAPGATFDDVVVLPSQRRGIYPVGPASTLRGDPFGLVRRQIVWTEPVEFVVHPRIAYLDSLGSGLLRDLEGQSTNDVSMSDLAFHTLREYAPGDDRRHIHWLSTAKRSGTTGSDEFMVRQFLDTRRSHIGVIVDCHTAAWVDEDEFETAVSAGASVAARALRDGMDLTEVTGPFLLSRPQKHTALDLFSRARIGDETLDVAAARLAQAAPSVSAVLVITGPLSQYVQLRRAKSLFGSDVNVVGLRVEHGAKVGLQRSGGLSVLTIGSLRDLPIALKGGLG